MSVRFLNNNASNNTDVAAKTLPTDPPPLVTPWVRNPSWPACEANSGDNRVRGLYAVWPSEGNFIAMNVAGNYTVDFGDGTTTNYTSGTQANYEYIYSAAALVGTEAPVTFTDTGDLVTRTAHGYTDGMQVKFFNITTTTGIVNGQVYFVINATANTFQVAATSGGAALALTNDGTGQLLPYRVATVTITPQGGSSLTSINLFVKHNQSGLPNGYTTGWLDLAYASPDITTLTLSSDVTTTVRQNFIERIRLNQLGAITSFVNLFFGLVDLQNVEIADSITTVTSTSGMFESCTALRTAPLFNTVSVTNMSRMFHSCTALQTVPLFNTASVTTMETMFTTCRNLQTVPLFNTDLVTTMSSMFTSCTALQTVPLFNTASVTTMVGMFSSCTSLQTVPLFNTALVTTMASMFGTCSALQTVPLFNTTLVTTMGSMFSQCRKLQSVPLFNTASVTNMSVMFSGCVSLQTVPLFNTDLVTTMSNMFNSCAALQTVPLFNTASVTNISSMFSTCTALQTVPLFNTASVTNMSSMFTSCTALQTVPLFNTASVTNISSMFSSCAALQTVPLFNTASVTNMAVMFASCVCLDTIPLLNTSAVTDMSNMFNGCRALNNIPALVTTAVASSGGFANMFLFCQSLARIEAKNFRFTFSVSTSGTGCKLSATALNEIYTNLPTVTGQTITVTGNYGTATDNPAIATAKGWTVTG